MAHRKTAIAIPADLLDEVDEAARSRGESRSRFISRVLALAVRARRDLEITRRLDALFADDVVADAQRREAEDLRALGLDWTDERW
jgi:metal-responsive CopG/Arc/MetJ family transcriptional regulator